MEIVVPSPSAAGMRVFDEVEAKFSREQGEPGFLARQRTSKLVRTALDRCRRSRVQRDCMVWREQACILAAFLAGGLALVAKAGFEGAGVRPCAIGGELKAALSAACDESQSALSPIKKIFELMEDGWCAVSRRQLRQVNTLAACLQYGGLEGLHGAAALLTAMGSLGVRLRQPMPAGHSSPAGAKGPPLLPTLAKSAPPANVVKPPVPAIREPARLRVDGISFAEALRRQAPPVPKLLRPSICAAPSEANLVRPEAPAVEAEASAEEALWNDLFGPLDRFSRCIRGPSSSAG